MDYDERSVCIFLRSYPGQFVSPRIVSRRLGGRRQFHENPLWALPLLTKLVEKGLVETDAQGHYRIKRRDPMDRRKRTWVSPQIKGILDRSSKDFSKVYTLENEEEPDLV